MAKKGSVPWNKGKVGIQIAWNKGLTKENDERVAKYSNSKKGSVLSDEHKEKIRRSKLGKKTGPISDEHKLKISKSNKGKHKRRKTEREKQHLSEILKGRKAVNRYTYLSLMKNYPMIFEDHIIRPYNDFIQIRCSNCLNWFEPRRQDISEKIRQIKTGTGLRYLFCSDECKQQSYLYRMKKDPIFLEEYEKYCREVEIETRKSIKLFSDKIDDYKLRSYDYHLDHKFSMIDGFNNQISPKIIGHWKNLQILTKFENESKGGNSSITLKELKRLTKND